MVIKSTLAGLKLGSFVGIVMSLAKAFELTGKGVSGFITSSLKLAGIVALVAFLYLLWDELYTLWNGGDTLIGRFIDSLFGFNAHVEVVKQMHEAWAAMGEWWAGEGQGQVQVFARALAGGIVLALKSIVKTTALVIGGFQMMFDALSMNNKASKDLTKMSGIIDSMKSDFSGTVDYVNNGPNSAKLGNEWGGSFGGKGSVEVGAITVVNNISGVSDPKEAAKQAGKSTRDAMGGAEMRSAFAAAPGGG